MATPDPFISSQRVRLTTDDALAHTMEGGQPIAALNLQGSDIGRGAARAFRRRLEWLPITETGGVDDD